MTYPDPKPLASLSGSLLARKGQAAPAMRRQNMMALGTVGTPAPDHLEDLGWDDMGHEPGREPGHNPGHELGHDAGYDHASGGFAGLSPMAASPLAPVAVAPVSAPAAPVAYIPIAHAPREDVSPMRADLPPVVHQQRVLAEEFAPEAPSKPKAPVVLETAAPAALPTVVKTVRTRAAPGSRGKAAFTLRLDAERHLKLRVVCALRHRSAQQIVTEALDAYLSKQPIPADLVNGSSPPSSSSRGMN